MMTMNDARLKRAFLIGLGVVFSTEFLIRDVLLPTSAKEVHIQLAIGLEWLLFLLLVFYWIPKVEGQPLESIGVGKFKMRYLWSGIGGYLIALLFSIISGLILESVGLDSIRSLQPTIKAYRFPTLLGLFLTGTIVEEVFYRGYLIERLTILTQKRWLAALSSWLLFSLVHLKFFGLGPTIDVSVLSAFLVLVYLKENSIWPGVVLHGVNGLFAYLVFPLLL
ncbi:lysostaphin resistance A-like protein [Chloroflexota bacterium]